MPDFGATQPTDYFPPLPIVATDPMDMYHWLQQQTLIANQITTGSIAVGQIISSSNYVAGTSGWMIDGDGNAEFNSVIIRGDLYSSNWNGAVPASLSTFDPAATDGFYLDSSLGTVQFAQGVFIGDSTAQGLITSDTTEVHMLLSMGPLATDPNLEVTVDQASAVLNLSVDGNNGFFMWADKTGQFSSLSGSSIVSGTTTMWWELYTDTTTAALYIGQGDGTSPDGKIYQEAALGRRMWLENVRGDLSIKAKGGHGYISNSTIGWSWFSDDPGVDVYMALDSTGLELDKGQHKAPVGSSAAPTFSFFGDPDTGMYRFSADKLGWSTAGVSRMALDAGGLTFDASVQIVPGVGSSTAPAYSFASDLDTGMFRHGANGVTIQAGGDGWRFATQIDHATAGVGSFLIPNQVGDATTATYSFGGDQNTGMFRQGADSLGFTAGGTERVRMTSAGILFTTPNTSASAADLRSGSSGLTNIVRSTSSRKYKKNFRKIVDPWTILRQLNPVTFWSIPDERDMVGFVAEEVGDAIPNARDGENYDHRAVLAYAVAGLNDLDGRVRHLEEIVKGGKPWQAS